MTYRTRRTSGTGSLFGVLVILAVLLAAAHADAAESLPCCLTGDAQHPADFVPRATSSTGLPHGVM